MKTCESNIVHFKDQPSAVLFSRKESVLPKFLGSDFVILHNYIYCLGDHFDYHVQDSLLPTFPIRESQATYLKSDDSIETTA